ncbi:MAG: HNH endonuclease [Planctomycetia bacterium]|nr:HNH endonuclease [Planctomycetia bacterium]
MIPFEYPEHPFVRRHGPQGYRQPASFRPWLRDEFSLRCVYCLRREQWDRATSLNVEHFLPSRRFPNQRLAYDNLWFACSRCNSAIGDRLIDDPSQALLSHEVIVENDGQIIGRSVEARASFKLSG